MTGLMTGKCGLIMGLANDKSLAWGIAKKLSEAGAQLAISYQGEVMAKRVKPLAAQLDLRRDGLCAGRADMGRCRPVVDAVAPLS